MVVGGAVVGVVAAPSMLTSAALVHGPRLPASLSAVNRTKRADTDAKTRRLLRPVVGPRSRGDRAPPRRAVQRHLDAVLPDRAVTPTRPRQVLKARDRRRGLHVDRQHMRQRIRRAAPPGVPQRADITIQHVPRDTVLARRLLAVRRRRPPSTRKARGLHGAATGTTNWCTCKRVTILGVRAGRAAGIAS